MSMFRTSYTSPSTSTATTHSLLLMQVAAELSQTHQWRPDPAIMAIIADLTRISRALEPHRPFGNGTAKTTKPR